MKIPHTLSRYLARTYATNVIFLLLALLSIIYLFDTVELIRRASKRADIPLSLVLEMGLLKLPEVGQVLLPFAILFSAMFTFWQLSKRNELVVVRSAGFSVWQFIAPIIGVALVIGVLQMTVINPVGSLLISKFEVLESRLLKREKNQIALFREGLWLRQDAADGEEYAILHAEKITQPDWLLKNVTVLFFAQDNTFLRRIDAMQATLEPSKWVLENTTTHSAHGTTVTNSELSLATNLTKQDVEDSFSSPESMSFWKLPSHINTLEETGFDASRLRVHYYNLLAQPLLFAAMILLAATVSLRPPRQQGGLLLVSAGVFIGFFVFFMSSFLQALGASQQIPPFLAAWSPGLICLLFGLTIVMSLEDG